MAVIRRDFLPGNVAPLLAAAGIDGVVAVRPINPSPKPSSCSTWRRSMRSSAAWLGGSILRRQISRGQPGPVARHPGTLKGFRHIAQGEPDDFLARPDVVRGCRDASASTASPYDILIYPRQLAAAERLVARCPDVRFILDHCAKPASSPSGDIDGVARRLRAPARARECHLQALRPGDRGELGHVDRDRAGSLPRHRRRRASARSA